MGQLGSRGFLLVVEQDQSSAPPVAVIVDLEAAVRSWVVEAVMVVVVVVVVVGRSLAPPGRGQAFFLVNTHLPGFGRLEHDCSC